MEIFELDNSTYELIYGLYSRKETYTTISKTLLDKGLNNKETVCAINYFKKKVKNYKGVAFLLSILPAIFPIIATIAYGFLNIFYYLIGSKSYEDLNLIVWPLFILINILVLIIHAFINSYIISKICKYKPQKLYLASFLNVLSMVAIFTILGYIFF